MYRLECRLRAADLEASEYLPGDSVCWDDRVGITRAWWHSQPLSLIVPPGIRLGWSLRLSSQYQRCFHAPFQNLLCQRRIFDRPRDLKSSDHQAEDPKRSSVAQV
ncbi:hypothetical protein [Ensifer adhaerens]|uniref:hypothetical protein n=1 Tax=Ensifer adhaerens TaxID=106592 RepID=UPI0008074460|nr:hypothetical protein [Ensifer adhaerens]